MAPANLHRQARPLRYLGYLLLALAVGSLPTALMPAWGRGGALLLCVLWPPLADVLQRGGDNVRTRSVQCVELFVLPVLLTLASLPVPLLLAVALCLVSANIALTGASSMVRAAALLGSGFALGLGLRVASGMPALQPAAAGVVWSLGAAQALLYSLALSARSYHLTQRLAVHRTHWQERARVLAQFAPPGLPAATTTPQRRWLSLCMVDLVDFTRCSANLPPEAVAQVLDDLLDVVVSEAAHTGGTLDKFMGDGALVFFAATERPAAAAGAVAFARALLRRLPALNARWHGFGVLAQLQLRAGIASGYCSVGGWGTRNVRAYTVIGASVALAQRLQAAATPNSVLLCPVSARLLAMATDNNSLTLPDDLVAEVAGEALRLQASICTLAGFPEMRVYRVSAKVRPEISA